MHDNKYCYFILAATCAQYTLDGEFFICYFRVIHMLRSSYVLLPLQTFDASVL